MLRHGIFCTLVLMLAGCGGVPLAPVTARVTLDGKPLAQAVVRFVGEGFEPPLTHAPSGIADSDGVVRPRYQDDQVGIPPGNYKVAVILNAEDPLNDFARIGPNLLPARYADPTTSGLAVTVPPTGGELPTLELKSTPK
ncbi:MAG: DUF4198 domain-containing protein [Bacteroidales bacterium]|nr:DUF4198 domain-containing protein [Bacteroidales bacterium]